MINRFYLYFINANGHEGLEMFDDGGGYPTLIEARKAAKEYVKKNKRSKAIIFQKHESYWMGLQVKSDLAAPI